MSKFISVIMLIVIFIALIMGLSGYEGDFSSRLYVERLQNVPRAPSIPSPDFQTGNWITATGNFFLFVGNCLAYPLRLVVFVGQVVNYIFGGVYVWQ